MADLRESGITRVSTVAAWSSQGVANTQTDLYTVPTGKVFVPMFVVIRTVSASMATCVITLGLKAGAGAACNEFRGDVTLTNLTGTTKYAIIHQQDTTRNTPDGGLLLTAAQVFAVEITTADADGGTATIDTFGYIY